MLDIWLKKLLVFHCRKLLVLLYRLQINNESEKASTPRELIEQVLDIGNGTEKLSEEDRAKIDNEITAKLKAGKKLSQKELDYVLKNNPIMYAHVMRIQRMADVMKEELKHAKSKEEADRIVSSSMGCISKNDPDREFIVAAINRISTEFHKSGAYDKLPNTVEEVKKKATRELGDVFSSEDDEDNGIAFDLKNWSPLTEVYDSMPTFSVGA